MIIMAKNVKVGDIISIDGDKPSAVEAVFESGLDELTIETLYESYVCLDGDTVEIFS